jgi:hypothetical protein
LFSYFAYGLGIHSTIAIPEFVAAQVSQDVSIDRLQDYTPEQYIPPQILEKPWSLKLDRDEAILYLKTVGIFLVQNGRQIMVMPAPGASEQMIRFYLVGTIMAILLYQRGLLVLHASAVEMQGGAVAFLGVSGAGKSSTIATLQAHGHRMIADDVAAVDWQRANPVMFPGFPQVKLSAEMATALGHNFEQLLPLHPDEEKRGYRITQAFPRSPLPIHRLYVLADAPTMSIEPLPPQAAAIELVRHSRPTTLFHSGGISHFLQCTQLAKQITVYRLNRPRSLALLPDLAQFIERDVTRSMQQVMV